MSNPKRHPEGFTAEHLGEQKRGFEGNKGKKMQSKENDEPKYIQPKGK